MANRARGEVSVRIGDEDYILVYSIGALASIETELGKNPTAAMIEIERSALALTSFLKAGLSMSADEVSNLRPAVLPVCEKIVEAIELAYYGVDGAPKDDGKPQKKRT